MRLLKNTILSCTAPAGKRCQRLEILDHDGIGLDAFGARADAAAERERGHGLRIGCEHLRIRLRRAPSAARWLRRYARWRIPGAAFRAAPRPRRPCRRQIRPGEGRPRWSVTRELIGGRYRRGRVRAACAAAVRSARVEGGGLSAADGRSEENSRRPMRNRVVLFAHGAALMSVPREWAAILGHMYIIPRVHPFVPYGQRYRTCHRVCRRRRLDAAL